MCCGAVMLFPECDGFGRAASFHHVMSGSLFSAVRSFACSGDCFWLDRFPWVSFRLRRPRRSLRRPPSCGPQARASPACALLSASPPWEADVDVSAAEACVAVDPCASKGVLGDGERPPRDDSHRCGVALHV